ncbi:MAG: hypothetical protein ACR2GV_01065, partial [Gaiellaceae bacterium]
MRVASVVVAVLALLAVPASAAQIDPVGLVLRQADVPAGFLLDPDESGPRSNAVEVKEYPEVRAAVRWGRVTGYQAAYTRKTRNLGTIESRADVFDGANGAHKLLGWVDSELRKSGFAGQKRAAVNLGSEGWVHWASGSGLDLSVVVWRQGRVFA